MKRFALSLMGFGLLLALAVWYLRTIYDESLQFEPYSAAYYVLVPSDIACPSLSRFGLVESYGYNAADGPKPEVITAEIFLSSNNDQALGQMRDYFVGKGYKKSSQETYSKGNLKIEIVADEKCKAGCKVTLSLMRYL